MNSPLRIGNFTSSEIYCLTIGGKEDMSPEELAKFKVANPKSTAKQKKTMFGDKAMTYIEECNYERKLKRPIDSDTTARATRWGHVMEAYVFKFKLDMSYQGHFQITKAHPLYPEWVGSVDALRFISKDVLSAGDVKCPFTMKSFCKLVDPFYDGLQGIEAMKAIRFGWTDKKGVERKKHPDGEKFWWQLISNAAIHGCKFAELIVYCPYQREHAEIRKFVDEDPANPYSNNPNETTFINWGTDQDLPWLQNDGYYKDLTVIQFEVPQEDIDNLTNRVLHARTMLIPQ